MSKRRSYSEKLKDPRWQKLRLKILERAGWKCQTCDSKDKTLVVHHGYYERGLEPWEYEEDTLWCLCQDCHQEAEDLRRDFYYEAAKVFPLSLSPIEVKIAYSMGYDRFLGPLLHFSCRSVRCLPGYRVTATKMEDCPVPAVKCPGCGEPMRLVYESPSRDQEAA